MNLWKAIWISTSLLCTVNTMGQVTLESSSVSKYSDNIISEVGLVTTKSGYCKYYQTRSEDKTLNTYHFIKLNEKLEKVDSITINVDGKDTYSEIFEVNKSLYVFSSFSEDDFINADLYSINLIEFNSEKKTIRQANKETVHSIVRGNHGYLFQNEKLLLNCGSTNSLLSGGTKNDLIIADFGIGKLLSPNDPEHQVSQSNKKMVIHDALVSRSSNEFTLFMSGPFSNNLISEISVIKISTVDGNVLSETIEIPKGVQIVSVSGSQLQNDRFLLLGSCSDQDSKSTAGSIFVTAIKEGSREFFSVLSHDELDHFYVINGHCPSEQCQNGWKSDAEKSKASGKNFKKNNYTVVSHESSINKNGGFSILSSGLNESYAHYVMQEGHFNSRHLRFQFILDFADNGELISNRSYSRINYFTNAVEQGQTNSEDEISGISFYNYEDKKLNLIRKKDALDWETSKFQLDEIPSWGWDVKKIDEKNYVLFGTAIKDFESFSPVQLTSFINSPDSFHIYHLRVEE